MAIEPAFPRWCQRRHQICLGLTLLGTRKHYTSSRSLVAGRGQFLVLVSDTCRIHLKAPNGRRETLGDSLRLAQELAASRGVGAPSAMITASLTAQVRVHHE